ncbi:MAG: type IV pilus modification protein PilV [Dokdonella sp.]
MHRRKVRGFSLLEVMIAVFVFSLGLLGLAGLMVVSVKTNQSAYLRTQASFLAQSMADRMRANTGWINTYNGTYNASTASGSDPCAAGAVCAPPQLVVRDQLFFSQQLVAALPNVTGLINCTGLTLGTATHRGAAPYNGLCQFTIQWDEATLNRSATGAPLAAGTPTAQTFAWVFQP